MAPPQQIRATIILLLAFGSGIRVAVDAFNVVPPDSIGVLCEHAVYQDSCREALLVSASKSDVRSLNNATAQKLVTITLRAALAIVHKSHALAKTCLKKQSPQGLHLLERQAVEDCTALMDSARDQLDLATKNLMSSVDSSNSPSERAAAFVDLNVRLSAALSFQTTCSDGFQFVRSGKCEKLILEAQEQVSEALLNALNLAKKLSKHEHKMSRWEGRKTLSTMSSRGFLRGDGENRGREEGKDDAEGKRRWRGRKVEDEFPDWVSYKDRKKLLQMERISADVVVAIDGSGQYKSIAEALESIQNNYSSTGSNGSAAGTGIQLHRTVLYIKQGIYNETFELPRSLPNLTFMGDGINRTIITGNNNVASGLFNTFRTSTVGILADGFMARDITFQNTAGPEGYQAVALKVSGDMAVFYRCSFEGYQDTLYALAGRQFYRDCKIYGTVDFIFGNAIASFQTCEILARRPLPQQKNTMTAQGRRVPDDISGFSFQNCSFQGAENMTFQGAENMTYGDSYHVQTYLGRPWKAFSRTVILQSYLGGIIEATGWLSWNASNPFTDTVYYGEFQNYGPGSSTANRVTWLGVHPALNASEAVQFTADNFISGSAWLPLSQVSYTSGLSSDSQH